MSPSSSAGVGDWRYGYIVEPSDSVLHSEPNGLFLDAGRAYAKQGYFIGGR